MVYLSHFTFPTGERETDFFWGEKRTCYDSFYPFRILSQRNLRMLDFEPVTILYGGNGSGKTTLVKLLLRLYDPDGGRICYHGMDIRNYQVMAYRRSIGSVFQDFKIYAATLKENVLMDVMYEIPSDDSIAECILTKKAVDGEEKPLVRYRDRLLQAK